MAILPPPVRTVTVFIDGSRVISYRKAILRDGRVLAPVDPYLTRIATQISYDGTMLVVTRGDRFAQVLLPRRPVPRELQWTYVPIAAVVATLGVFVHYDARHHILEVRRPHASFATPTPFNPAVPQARPTSLFTPIPVATPRPVFTGKPLPRRTPVPWQATPSPQSTARDRP